MKHLAIILMTCCSTATAMAAADGEPTTVQPPKPPSLWENVVGFMEAPVYPWMDPALNALGDSAEGADTARGATFQLIRNGKIGAGKATHQLLRFLRGHAKELGKYAGKLGAMDLGGNVSKVLAATYYGDLIGAAEDGANAVVSGGAAFAGRWGGIAAGGAIGFQLGGPYLGVAGAVAGGVLGPFASSYINEATAADAIKNKFDEYHRRALNRYDHRVNLARARSYLSQVRNDIHNGDWADADRAAQRARIALVLAGQGNPTEEIIDQVLQLSRDLEELAGHIAYFRRSFPEAFDEDLAAALLAAAVARERIEHRDYGHALDLIDKALSRRDRLTSSRGREVIEELEELGQLAKARELLDKYGKMVSDAETLLRKDEPGEANERAEEVKSAITGNSLLDFPDDTTRARAKKILDRAERVLHATTPVVDVPSSRSRPPLPRREEFFTGSWIPAGASPLGNVRIDIYKQANGYQVMPEHGLPGGLFVRGFYRPEGDGSTMRMKLSVEARAARHVRTRAENLVTHRIRGDRLIFRARVVDEELSGDRVISQKLVHDFTVELRRLQ